MKPLAALALITAVFAAGSAQAQDPIDGVRPFQVGFADALFGQEDGGRWAARTAASNADAVRVNLYWSLATTGEPENPRLPGDPAYDFNAIDRAVTSADRAGLDVLMTVLSAPRFAEGPYRPDHDEAPAGTWRPDPEAFGDFAHVVAQRYSGFHPDPEAPGSLPEVDLYSAWNEPNISSYLTPQFENGRNESAETYVELLNAFHDEVKEVNPDATIATGGTAPFGDPEARRRTAPLEFWREVLCLAPDGTEADYCVSPEQPRFDLLAHHPISYLSSPSVPAVDPGDLTAADFGKLGDLLEQAEAAGTVPEDDEHDLLAPEIWWETAPPERLGISPRRHARYTALAIYMLWREGAEGVYFLQVRDAERVRGEPRLRSYQTGVYTYGGRRKPAYRAVQFPFVGDRIEPGAVRAWGRAPAAGRLRIEVKRRGGRWRGAASRRVADGEIFSEELRLEGKALLRARVAGEQSLLWRQRR